MRKLIISLAAATAITAAAAPALAQPAHANAPARVAAIIIDSVSNALGLLAHPSAATTAGGGVGLVGSIAAIVLLVRLNPRRAARRAAAGPASGRQPASSGTSMQ